MRYRKFKKSIINDYTNIIKGLKNGSLSYNNIIRKYPQAMLIIGMANGDYYRNASGNSEAPNGIYPINYPDTDIFMYTVSQDCRSKQQIINTITNFKQTQAPLLSGKDLYYLMLTNNNNMVKTTTKNWTPSHSYYQPFMRLLNSIILLHLIDF